MAHNKSALKRNRQAVEDNQRNRTEKSKITSAAKKFLASITAGDKTKAAEACSEYFSVLDKAAKKGIIKTNNADRHKARAAAKLLVLVKKA